jgi:adenine-specific DNA glycosylase
MYQLPTTAWLEIREEALAQKPPSGLAKAAALGVEVRHSFTHFDLILEICSAKPLRTPRGIWVQEGDLSRYAMPTLMKKALKLAVTAAGA